jgi:uncharacterized protein
MFYPGGAFSLESALYWAARGRGQRDEPPSVHAMNRGLNGFPLIEADDRAVGDIGVFDDWVNHPENDAYWKAIDGEHRARDVRSPVLLMAGWSDPFLPSQLHDFETIRAYADQRVSVETRLIIGPWTHADAIRFPDGTTAGAYRPASIAPSIPWFDHQLLGRALDHSLSAPVRLYVMGENVWRDEQEWPLARAQRTKFYLRSGGHANTSQGDGRLSAEPPTTNETADSYVYDPKNPVPTRGGAMLGPNAGISEQNDIETRQDVLIYSTAPLGSDLEITGPLSANFIVDTTAVNTDFTVKLVDVFPNGKTYNVSDGILRRGYGKSGGQVVKPSEITIEMWPTSMLFRRGHRIRIEVSSSNFPRYDRNTNTGNDIATDIAPIAVTQTLYHSPRYRSAIVLPIIPR